MFPPEGEVALMFLKPYTGQSDDGLIEMLNGSIHMQMFCGVLIDPANPIKNGKIVSAIRQRIAGVLDIRELQKILYGKWSGSSERQGLVSDRRHLLREPSAVPDRCKAVVGMLRVDSITYNKDLQGAEGTVATQQVS